MGIPMIKPGDEIYIYGAGFSVGENITFQISDYFGSFHLGSYTVVNNAGIFSWQIEANWSNYNWQPNGSILSCITAKGDKGSKAIAIVEIGTE
jgi:hypothetical protein